MPGLALILSGAVSLGSFEAGVLDELLYGLDQLARNGGKRYTLDVVTGASAGSMSAALVARAVMHHFAFRRYLREAWVDQIDIAELVKQTPDNALLDRTVIESIANRYLILRPGEPRARPAFAPDTLRLSFSLSNMNGVDYRLQARHAEADAFTATFFADRRRFTLGEVNGENRVESQTYWDHLREAAIASGNFPFAFAPATVATDPLEYEGSSIIPLPRRFTFVDGGIFNNEPIREAVQLAQAADGGELDPERVFLLVDANLNGSLYDRDFNPRASLTTLGRRLLTSLRGESAANDWLRALRVNNQIAWRELLLDSLVRMVAENELADPDRLIAQLQEAATAIVQEKRTLFPDRYPTDYLDDALARTARTHAQQLAGLGPGRTRILTLMIFLLNSIAGLDKKDRLNIDVIYATPGETAGDRLSSFGGFFNREWRAHDYRLGRAKANQLLPRMLDAQYPREQSDDEDLYTNPVDYSKVEMRDADPAKRRALLTAVERQAHLLVEANVKGKLKRWAAWTIARPILRKKVEKLLQLD